MTDISLDLVVQVGDQFGCPLNTDSAQRLKHFIDQLCHWGQKINLTSRPDPKTILERHLPDTFQLARALQSLVPPRGMLPESPFLTCVDFGSGAGLPCVPLAICLPEIKLTFVEPNQKKCAFLRTICHELQLSPHILAQRMEQVSLPGQDLVCSRATWSPEEWLTRALPWAKPGGHIVIFATHLNDLPPCPAPLQQPQTIPYLLLDGSPRLIALYAMPPLSSVSRETVAL